MHSAIRSTTINISEELPANLSKLSQRALEMSHQYIQRVYKSFILCASVVVWCYIQDRTHKKRALLYTFSVPFPHTWLTSSSPLWLPSSGSVKRMCRLFSQPRRTFPSRMATQGTRRARRPSRTVTGRIRTSTKVGGRLKRYWAGSKARSQP